jgi:hypothetical protein
VNPGAISRVIDCSECIMADSPACDDCVVSLLSSHSFQTGPYTASLRVVQLDDSEANTLDLFARVGLVPRVRHQCDRSMQPRAEKLGK